MKKLAVVLSVLALNGCAVYDAYMQTGFDNNEYLLITQIRADAQAYKKQCGNHLFAATNAVAISTKTDLFEKYSEQIPRNENGIRASKSLNEIAQGLANSYLDPKGQPSATFCKLKYSSIENSAYVIQHVVGSRPR
jgi:hypothetical protein